MEQRRLLKFLTNAPIRFEHSCSSQQLLFEKLQCLEIPKGYLEIML